MFYKTSGLIAGGLFAANEYKNYLILDKKKTELNDKITSAYAALSFKNSHFEKIKKKTAGMEWVTTTPPTSIDDLWHFEHLFKRDYYAVCNDVKQSGVLKSECVKIMKDLASEKSEFNSKNEKLKNNLYAKAKYIFFINDSSDLIKKIEALPLNENDQRGLKCDLGHWNTGLELAWVARTNEGELPSDLTSSNAAYLLNNFKSFAKEDLFEGINSNKSIKSRDLTEITKNSFAHLDAKLTIYDSLTLKVKYIDGSESKLEEVLQDFKSIDHKLNENAIALRDKALKNLEATEMLQAWDKRTVVSPLIWSEKFDRTKMGIAEVYAEQSLSIAHLTLSCVLSTQVALADRKLGKKESTLTKTHQKLLKELSLFNKA